MNGSEIIFKPVFPLWLILVFLAGGVAFSLFQLQLVRRRLSRQRWGTIILLRLATVTLLILLALNPSWVARSEVAVSPTLAILLDTSPSMGLSENSGKRSRLDEARVLLLEGSKPLLKSLAEKFEVRLYELGESLKVIKAGDLSNLKTGEKRGNLPGAIEKLAGSNSLALLFSDGKLEWGGPSSSNLPIFTLPLGDPEKYKDILIKTVKAPALAFRGREVTIDVAVKGYGYPGLKLPVALKEGERLITARDLRLDDRTGEGALSLSFIPQEVGSHTLSVSIPSQMEESVISNNLATFSLKVVRDKIRVLMVTGAPSMNYRFLRMALKNDPSIDLLSFVILRTPSNILNVPLQEQSLIPFPVETLFGKEMKSFDILVFDNFVHHPYFRASYLESVRNFVQGGGSLAIIGGPNFYGEGGFIGTAIEEILPVQWAGREGYRRSPFRVKLTRNGSVHPLTRLSLLEGENRNLWEEMPPLDGVNLLRSKSSGTVLMESADENSWPILTLGNYGKGRVSVLATDSAWKWYMGTVAQGKGPWAYQRFTERSVRWLAQDPSLDPIQLILPERVKTIGQEMELRIMVQEDALFAKSKEAISISVFSPEGAKIESQLKPGGQNGEYLASFRPEKVGTYKVKVETQAGQREESLFVGRSLENLDGFPQHEQLKQISDSTGGKILTARDAIIDELEQYGKKSRKRYMEESRFPIWGNAYVFIVLISLLTVEWYLRRRWGLI